MEGIGVLSPVDIRKVWPDEAKDFTPWLAENADLLGEALGMDVVHEQTEAGVGRYSADLVFREESTSRLVVVENMFGATDHDHLGKLITYAAGIEDLALLPDRDPHHPGTAPARSPNLARPGHGEDAQRHQSGSGRVAGLNPALHGERRSASLAPPSERQLRAVRPAGKRQAHSTGPLVSPRARCPRAPCPRPHPG